MKSRIRIVTLVLLLTLIVFGRSESVLSQSSFVFAVTNDQRRYTGPNTAYNIYDECEYYRGACEAIDALGAGAFMIVPGDLDPTLNTEWTISNVLGSSYLWYPVVGNHELPSATNYYVDYPGGQLHGDTTGVNMDWLRNYDYDPNGLGNPPDIVNDGPSGCPQTTFSFDYEEAHFVVLNEYCDLGGDTATDGDVPDHLYNWLVDDLAANSLPFVFVIGHEPAYPRPDEDTGRERHMLDSLNQHEANRDRFWNLLVAEGVTAYLCGHTHNYSAVRIDENGVIGGAGVWQIDAGHARGVGDTGSPSTFVRVIVGSGQVTYQTYRTMNPDDYCEYTLTDEWTTAPNAVNLTSFAVRGDGGRRQLALGIAIIALSVASTCLLIYPNTNLRQRLLLRKRDSGLRT
jgi:hypothetical protein